LLYLPHRIPFPPNKGDKIRTYHVLRHLSQLYEIYLGTFVDEPDDWGYVAEVERYCAAAKFVFLSKTSAKLASLRALFTGEPLTLAYFRSGELKRWVDDVTRTHSISRILVCSSSMAQYADGLHDKANVVVDFIDVDSEKWRQYARQSRWPMSALYAREGRQLLEYEKHVARRSDANVFVSELEADVFQRLTPDERFGVLDVQNGVDAEFFSPERSYENPFSPDAKALVFTGAMDYAANVDAVCWFVTEVFGIIKKQVPSAEFYVVGSRPGTKVKALANQEGVCVTGRVDDVRPYLAHSHAAVAPMRVARGLQNKVLEAIAMSKVVLATPAAMEGVRNFDSRDRYVASGPNGLADLAVSILRRPMPTNTAGRACIIEHFDWSLNVRKFGELLERGSSPVMNRTAMTSESSR